jgi:ADP-heptose:LPS heptosyltransferase
VVILGTGYIGDLVLATPTLRAIREAFPQARITLLVEERVTELFAEADLFDQLLTVAGGSRGDLLAHAGMLRAETPDVAVVLPHTVTAALFACATGAPIRVGHDSQGRRFLLTRTAPNEKTVHEVERLLGSPSQEDFIGARDKAILEVLYSAGLRINELVQLNDDDVDMVGEIVRVRGKGK